MPGKISFTLPEYRVSENGTWISQRVGAVRTESGVGAVSVRLANASSSAAGRATRNRDYTAIASQTLTWADGEMGTKFMDIAILQDEFIEGSEAVNLSLTGIVNAEYGVRTAQLIVVDDDTAVKKTGWTDIPINSPWRGSVKYSMVENVVNVRGVVTANEDITDVPNQPPINFPSEARPTSDFLSTCIKSGGQVLPLIINWEDNILFAQGEFNQHESIHLQLTYIR